MKTTAGDAVTAASPAESNPTEDPISHKRIESATESPGKGLAVRGPTQKPGVVLKYYFRKINFSLRNRGI